MGYNIKIKIKLNNFYSNMVKMMLMVVIDFGLHVSSLRAQWYNTSLVENALQGFGTKNRCSALRNLIVPTDGRVNPFTSTNWNSILQVTQKIWKNLNSKQLKLVFKNWDSSIKHNYNLREKAPNGRTPKL